MQERLAPALSREGSGEGRTKVRLKNPMEQLPEQKDDAALRAAADRIGAMVQEMYALGANDAEIPESQRILARMEAGEISPDDAVSQVARFLEQKQDYH